MFCDILCHASVCILGRNFVNNGQNKSISLNKLSLYSSFLSNMVYIIQIIIINVEIKVIFADRMFVNMADVRTCSGTGILPIKL